MVKAWSKKFDVRSHRRRTWTAQSYSPAGAKVYPILTDTRRSEHITPVLRSLHWLPVRQRITFKVATIVHKCLNGRAPVYLSNDLQYTGQRRTGMRSASAALYTGSSEVANCRWRPVVQRRWTTSLEHSTCFCSRHKLVLALQETTELVSLTLTATVSVTLNWRP